jgi:hypothetical protein
MHARNGTRRLVEVDAHKLLEAPRLELTHQRLRRTRLLAPTRSRAAALSGWRLAWRVAALWFLAGVAVGTVIADRVFPADAWVYIVGG